MTPKELREAPMFKIDIHYSQKISVVLAALWILFQMAGCAGDNYSSKGATRGTTTDAVAGAMGGLISALVFGGNPVDRAARDAVHGGAADSQVDQRVRKQRAAGVSALRKEIGKDSFDGLVPLAECHHDVSLSQAANAKQSKNPNFALAGLWLEVLSYADQGEEAKSQNLFPTIVEKDWDIESESQAEETMRKALNELMDIRREYKLPRVCM
jgi:hypothetical protein